MRHRGERPVLGGKLADFDRSCFDGPSIRVSGVRNSWLTLAKNSGLGAIDLGQRLGALAFLFVGARVGDRGRDLRRHQLEEAAILVVEA